MIKIDEKELENLYLDQTNTIRDIAKHFNVSTHTIYLKCKKMKLPSRKKKPEIENITGHQFSNGQLIAIKYIRNDKFGKAIWLFKCFCGKEKELNAASAKRELTTSCGCVKIKNSRKNHVGLISPTFWKKLQKSALRRNYEFTITMEEAWDIFEKQKGKCALSGVEIIIHPDSNNEILQTASPDRIDSSKGYTLENFQWVHKRVNRMKNVLSVDELIFWCRLIVNMNSNLNVENYDVNKLAWE